MTRKSSAGDAVRDFSPADVAWEERLLSGAGLRRLNPVWAKLEIVIGLSGAVIGLIVLRDHTTRDLLGGTLVVLGLYLAAAGHRSHLYQSMNRAKCVRAPVDSRLARFEAR